MAVAPPAMKIDHLVCSTLANRIMSSVIRRKMETMSTCPNSMPKVKARSGVR